MSDNKNIYMEWCPVDQVKRELGLTQEEFEKEVRRGNIAYNEARHKAKAQPKPLWE